MTTRRSIGRATAARLTTFHAVEGQTDHDTTRRHSVATTTPHQFNLPSPLTITDDQFNLVCEWYRGALGDSDKTTDVEDGRYYEGLVDGYYAVLNLLTGGTDVTRGQQQYTVELGVNLDDQRLCAAEAGVFTSRESAEAFATAAIGRTVDEIAKAHPPRWVTQMDTGRWDLPVAGWTIERFTDAMGTVETWDSTS